MSRCRATAGAVVATALVLLLSLPASAAQPSLTVEGSSALIGESIHATAELSESPGATGEITFEVFGGNDPTCTGSALAESTVSVSGEGQYVSEDFQPPTAGGYFWTARYSGNGTNEPAESVCGGSSDVEPGIPEATGSATSGTVGGAIHDTVTIEGGYSPSGSVVFFVYGPNDAECETPLATSFGAINGDEAVSGDFVPQQAGEYRWQAEYEGDANNEPFNVSCEAAGQTSNVAKASPGLTGSASTATVGGAIHDEVTFSGGFSPGGEVTFSVFAPGDTSCATPLETSTAPIASGKATSEDFVSQQAGEYRWTASFPGDGNNEGVELGCNESGQTSSVAKASPGLSGSATSTVVVGNTITDQATLSGGFSPGGQIVFRAYGPGDASCGGTAAYEATLAVSGNGPYSPAGFAPGPGVYRWTVEYQGDGNNQTSLLVCNASGQASAVGTINVNLTASATEGTVGTPVTAVATIEAGTTPGGQIVFRAFPPGNTDCSGAAAFTSTIGASGNGSYRSAAFVPGRAGSFLWTVAYTGDANHAPAVVGCGKVASVISRAKPAISGAAPQRIAVGNAFSDAATLQGGFAPNGTLTFRIYGPVAGGCAGSAFVNTVSVTGNGTVNSDLFVAQRPGRYSFAVSYSGDAENQPASEPCDSPSQVVQVVKRSPRVNPRAVLIGSRQISIRAHLSRAFAPTASITFRLYGPGDTRCRRKPKFSGGITVKKNGTFSLARYLATKRGVYRLSVGYSGDQRNRRLASDCSDAQPIWVK